MGDAKQLMVKPIKSSDANRIIRSLHYSGKVVNNSQVHLGVFMNGKCGGAMSFGPSLDKRKMLGIVNGTLWNEFIELNRMAFADWLPRNGESRCIGYAMRWLRKTYPWMKWVVSFADGTQCGDGTIYRASGFLLTGIKENNQIWSAPDTGVGKLSSNTFTRISLTNGRSKKQQEKARNISRTTMEKAGNILETGSASMKGFIEAGFKPLPGFQLRYIYFLDPTARDRLTVPILPFSEIARRGAGMYKGKPISSATSETIDTPSIHEGKGGETPTVALHSKNK